MPPPLLQRQKRILIFIFLPLVFRRVAFFLWTYFYGDSLINSIFYLSLSSALFSSTVPLGCCSCSSSSALTKQHLAAAPASASLTPLHVGLNLPICSCQFHLHFSLKATKSLPFHVCWYLTLPFNFLWYPPLSSSPSSPSFSCATLRVFTFFSCQMDENCQQPLVTSSEVIVSALDFRKVT